ncbi:MAG: hypothetical protein WC563_15690 [Brevundimonas sp.]
MGKYDNRYSQQQAKPLKPPVAPMFETPSAVVENTTSIESVSTPEHKPARPTRYWAVGRMRYRNGKGEEISAYDGDELIDPNAEDLESLRCAGAISEVNPTPDPTVDVAGDEGLDDL